MEKRLWLLFTNRFTEEGGFIMLKKWLIMMLVVITVGCFCQLNCFADDSVKVNISVEFPPGTYHGLQNQKDAKMFVSFLLLSESTEDFTVQYTIDDWTTVYEEQCHVIPRNLVVKEIPLSHLPKGVFTLKIRVKHNGETVFEESKPLVLIKYVESSYLDKYSRIGLHYRVSDRTDISREWHTEQTMALYYAGVRKVRIGQGIEWHNFERQKGVYDATFSEYKYMDLIHECGMEILRDLMAMNYAYQSGHPRLAKHMIPWGKSFTEYARLPYDYYALEVWNEPDLKKYYNGDDYGVMLANLTCTAGLALFDSGRNIPLLGMSCSGDANAPQYMRQLFKLGVYNYIDAVAFHPYYVASDIDSEEYQKRFYGYVNVVREQGGWLKPYITEVAWRIREGLTQDDIGEYLTKLYIYGDDIGSVVTTWFQIRDEDERDWHGISYINGEFKKRYAALANVGEMLGPSEYIGKIDVEQPLQGRIYTRKGEPMAVLWSTDKQNEYLFDLSTLSGNLHHLIVTDMYGNPVDISDGTIRLTRRPVFIQHVDKKWIAQALSYEAKRTYTDLCSRLKEITDIDFLTTAELKMNLSELPQSHELLELLKYNYGLGDILFERYNNATNFDYYELALALWDIHQLGEKISRAFAATVEYERPLYSAIHLEKLTKAADQKREGEKYAVLRFTDKIIHEARYYSKKAYYMKNEGTDQLKYGLAAGADAVSTELCRWGLFMLNIEKADKNRGILTYVDNPQVTAYNGTNVENIFTVYNNIIGEPSP